MIFIVGGRAQGKREFASQLAGLPFSQAAEGENISPQQLKDCTLLLDLDRLLWRIFTEEFSLTIEQLVNSLDRPGVVVTCTDVGGGIVPLSKEQRDYRDFVGKAGCQMAARADKVYRVFSGIASQIKGEETEE